MGKPFRPLTPDTFAELVPHYPWRGRRVTEVHLHHTYVPDQRTYRGLSSIESMWCYHTRELGWDDIAQHVSVGPEGTIWTGRDWGVAPASSAGRDPATGVPYNGTPQAGPFMVEMIGNFDRGEEEPTPEQLRAAVEVIARVQLFFGLPPEALRFHRDLGSPRTCPGTGVRRDDVVARVAERHREIRQATVERVEQPFDPALLETRLRVNETVVGIVKDLPLMGLGRGAGVVPAGEPPEEETSAQHVERYFSGENATVPAPAPRAEPGAEDGFQEFAPNPEVLSALRPHVINLNAGRLSAGGTFDTSRAEVDAIFQDHLPRRLRALPEGEKLPIVFYAHGGLVSEWSALEDGHQHVQWWNDNGVYPIYFVWETGLLETVGQLIRGAVGAAPAARGFTDWTDAAVERVFGPPARLLWTGMKNSAAWSVEEPEGGALYAARCLARFMAEHGERVELHAVGHSAGSILHAYFLPAALEQGGITFRTLSFLAPAIRMDAFKERLMERIGPEKGIEELWIYTMKKDWERADNVAWIYRKSLLYFIYLALEDRRKTPILGLEESLRRDEEVRELLGLAGNPDTPGQVVWSVSEVKEGKWASTSRKHGGFDNDPPTMESVALRVLGLEHNGQLRRQFPEKAPEGPGPLQGLGSPFAREAAPPAPAAVGVGGGRRLALCVGVNVYPERPLYGCVRDAESWAETLGGLGFEVRLLRDQEATWQRIRDEVQGLVRESRPGDVIAFQFAGHGTQVEDVSGDEARDERPDALDEAICPYGSMEDGSFLIDDDWVAIFAGLPEGVNFTCFFDCCHSQTIMRATRPTVRPPGGTARWFPATPEMNERHREFRRRLGTPRGTGDEHDRQRMRQVVFSACDAHQEAMEYNGQGDFTLRSTRVVQRGLGSLTNEGFHAAVVAEFGPSPVQDPQIDCADASRRRGFLLPVAAAPAAAAHREPAAGPSNAELARQIARAAATLAERL